ncbi:hypothetical protein CYLTODRAFT_420934 [Cylindrobasidium torrendii FP15055 ss-10]|uniref:LYC1 C-terminal domain-containing protein n=1 Tax=Cylindrobasidium torrendii FP15055 ss-10 TaxID=1314674 RepID=A0A0D7BGJ5_9AGAR|nr:hypothetical protein CYLTODRAFT_420934 [Cylindrobasidium torrendii FP15055 ss-10]
MTDLSNLILLPATEEQKLESRHRSFKEWGKDQTLEQYLVRDTLLEREEHALNGKFTTWVLTLADDPKTMEFKCSCETYRRDALVLHPSAQKPSSAPAFGIASVFTPAEHRKRGYAKHMMRLLHAELQRQDAIASVLWSDVGAKFYAVCSPYDSKVVSSASSLDGWIVRGAHSALWSTSQQLTANTDMPVGWRWLSSTDMPEVWKREDQAIAAQLSESVGNAKDKVLFSFLPSAGVAEFQVVRALRLWKALAPPLEHRGIELPNGQGLVTWSFDRRPNTLLVTRIRVMSSVSPEDIKQLLLVLMGLARTHQQERLEIWNMPEALIPASRELGFEHEERTAHLPSIKWYGPEPLDKVVWANNERFCWC